MVVIKRNKYTRLDDKMIVQEKTPYPNYQQTVHEYPCKNCGCYVTLYDKHHDETFCLQCGRVLKLPYEEINVPYGTYSTGKPYTGTGYTYSEKQFLKSRGKRKPTYISSSERNTIQYQHIISIFKTELCLSEVDIQDIWIIINKCGGIKKLAPATSSEKVILGICRYLLVNKGITGYLINFRNSIYREYGLTRKLYDKIISNIYKNMRLYECN